MNARPDRPVSTIMSWPVATIDHEATLQEAAEALAGDNIGVLLVTRDDAMVGSSRSATWSCTSPPQLRTCCRGGDGRRRRDRAARRHHRHGGADHGRGGRPSPAGARGRLIAGMLSTRDVLEVLADAVASEDVVVVRSGTRVVVLQD